MSRALDKDVARSLGEGSPAAAYKAIAEALTQSNQDGLLEIEILGRSHILEKGAYLLQDGLAIAVSKLGLVQAFLVARGILKQHIEATEGSDDDAGNNVKAATAVILLMDPEHLTAANTRKRFLQEELAGEGARTAISRELWLTDSLLTSRSHRHTKSPTLWSHRRWLLNNARALGETVDVMGSMAGVVMTAADRHARNYYAWDHARYLVTLNEDGSKEAEGQIAESVKTWCFKHHNDISGWSFYHFILDRAAGSDPSTFSAAVAEVLRLSSSLRWTNESVWVFLRTTMATGLVAREHEADFREAMERYLSNDSDVTAPTKKMMEASRVWYETQRYRTYRPEP